MNAHHQMRHARGVEAEQMAAAALAAAGWRIDARNYRIAGLEIDILAHDPHGQLVAVEVRRRAQLGAEGPFALLGARKIAALHRQRDALPEITRIDLLFVLGEPGHERLRLVRGIA
jgi:putative endonuclease